MITVTKSWLDKQGINCHRLRGYTIKTVQDDFPIITLEYIFDEEQVDTEAVTDWSKKHAE